MSGPQGVPDWRGAAMLSELDRTARLVRGMVEAVRIPVTQDAAGLG